MLNDTVYISERGHFAQWILLFWHFEVISLHIPLYFYFEKAIVYLNSGITSFTKELSTSSTTYL